ncbi:MAG: hypothetical protein JGK01_21350, partial [Microcoleus sp. PH2017_03_ELD_O_A]|nr:hypothetical protein [Microcoleus sp. PH2017_03_ELD_O_A]
MRRVCDRALGGAIELGGAIGAVSWAIGGIVGAAGMRSLALGIVGAEGCVRVVRGGSVKKLVFSSSWMGERSIGGGSGVGDGVGVAIEIAGVWDGISGVGVGVAIGRSGVGVGVAIGLSGVGVGVAAGDKPCGGWRLGISKGAGVGAVVGAVAGVVAGAVAGVVAGAVAGVVAGAVAGVVAG